MQAQFRDVMYVGTKPRKQDNVTGSDAHVWNGLGDIQKVTPMDAEKLSKHPSIWVDVTEWPEAKRISAVEAVRETIRDQQRKYQPVRTLAAATVTELQDELSRRVIPSSLPAPSAAARTPVRTQPNEPVDEHGQLRSRPANSEELLGDIVGAMLELDPDKKELWDGEGQPALQAINESLGYKISKSELNAAVKKYQQPRATA